MYCGWIDMPVLNSVTVIDNYFINNTVDIKNQVIPEYYKIKDEDMNHPLIRQKAPDCINLSQVRSVIENLQKMNLSLLRDWALMKMYYLSKEISTYVTKSILIIKRVI